MDIIVQDVLAEIELNSNKHLTRNSFGLSEEWA
jgi:hypothetical protein